MFRFTSADGASNPAAEASVRATMRNRIRAPFEEYESMNNLFRGQAILVVAGALFLAGCATSQADSQLASTSSVSDPQCPSKWVASGNDGAKAGRYYQPKCEQ